MKISKLFIEQEMRKMDNNTNKNIIRYTLRINNRLFQKFRFASAYEGRNATGQLTVYIRDYVKKFEQEHGPIDLEKPVDDDI